MSPEQIGIVWIIVTSAGIFFAVLTGFLAENLNYLIRRISSGPKRKGGRPPAKRHWIVWAVYMLSFLAVIFGTAIAETAPSYASESVGIPSPENVSNLENLVEPATTLKSVCSTPKIVIPDNGALRDIISVIDSGRISDLDVYLNVLHDYAGDLDFTLDHVGSSGPVTIIDQPGNLISESSVCNGHDYSVTVNDEGPDGDIETQCDNVPAINGNRIGGDPPGPVLSAFDGDDFSGSWVLTIKDNTKGDVGTLIQWCLIPNEDRQVPVVVASPTIVSTMVPLLTPTIQPTMVLETPDPR